ncbi:hypothetical protein D3C81_2162220 [compost metagenome]
MPNRIYSERNKKQPVNEKNNVLPAEQGMDALAQRTYLSCLQQHRDRDKILKITEIDEIREQNEGH